MAGASCSGAAPVAESGHDSGMNETELMRTLKGDAALAQTLVEHPGDTIDPFQKASTGGRHALEALRRAATGGDLRIEKIRTLGEGGMGIVHLATQATLGRHVAIKTLRDGAKDLDATVRILREAWVTGALEHPNVVPVYDVGVDESGAPFIVMKRVEGKAWADVMKDPAELERLLGLADPLEANLRVFLAVCNAVHFAHARDILHRDVKPENVMIGEFGEVYLLDWGIAVSLAPDPSGRLPELSQARGIAGTPSYMAPEMLLGDPAGLSARTDVYLLGATLYEIFAGAPPHVGDSGAAMASSILLSKPTFGPGFPSEAQQLCERALSRDPENRFESAEALKKAVEDYLAHRGSRKLARDAKRSLDAMLRTIADDAPSEERTLAIFNLLGECRFGYRAALAAWSGNAGARRGLDRALLAVVELEVNEGDPKTASALLREVVEPPAEIVARVDAALRARDAEDRRLKKLEHDMNPAIGTRTRTLIGGIFGVAWTALPLVGWGFVRAGIPASHWALVGGSVGSLTLGFGLYAWARETLNKTLLNRTLARTLGFQMVLQVVLAFGAYLMGLTPDQSATLHLFAWASVQTALALWVQRCFGVAAAVCAASFLAACALPTFIYPLMSLCNATFMFILVLVWLPRADIERFAEHERRIVGRARRLFHPTKASD
jgi:eukaryotic-like serine/threonine-protein kinase